MDLAIDWTDRHFWGGLSDEDFAASELARAHLATVLTPGELRHFDQSHPIWGVVSIIGTQAGFTRMGEGMRLFVSPGSPFERSIIRKLRKRGNFFSIWAELEVALWFDRRGFAVSYQPSRAGPDLAVTAPSGVVTPVEVKAPRRSDDLREHERFLCACVNQYPAELNLRGLQSLHLELVNDPRAEPWSAANHQDVLEFVQSVPRRTPMVRPSSCQAAGRPS